MAPVFEVESPEGEITTLTQIYRCSCGAEVEEQYELREHVDSNPGHYFVIAFK